MRPSASCTEPVGLLLLLLMVCVQMGALRWMSFRKVLPLELRRSLDGWRQSAAAGRVLECVYQ